LRYLLSFLLPQFFRDSKLLVGFLGAAQLLIGLRQQVMAGRVVRVHLQAPLEQADG